MKFNLTDEQFTEVAKSMSAMTALIEACDWDEERAYNIFDDAFETLLSLHEYSKYDPDLITGEESYRHLMKTNMKMEVSAGELQAVLDLIDNEVRKDRDRQVEIE
jgi:hypothetical protein|tara:strand:- start:588 stop:902 length:315 start_codon:yes stop_codon:yes gene_type:complete